MTGPDPDLGLFTGLQRAVAGRYSLDRRLGAGGMGIVFLARDVRLERPVAIKLLRNELSARATARDRFLAEARLAAGLAHPNIVPIHEAESAGELTWYVMAYIQGRTLGDLLRQRGPLPASEMSRILREVAWALAYAHQRGIVHRDIKPDNILLEEGGRVLVLDFGIAQRTVEVADAIGTIGFLPPEQRHPGPPDPRSDLYALAITAATALRAKVPGDAERAASWIATDAPWAASLLTACLAPEPSGRPESARVVAEGLVPPVPQPLHPAVRAWLREADPLRTLGWGWTFVMGPVSLFGMASGVGTFASALLAALVIWPLTWGVRLWQTRRALAQGVTLLALREALARHAEDRRRELRTKRGRRLRSLGAATIGFQAGLTIEGVALFYAIFYGAGLNYFLTISFLAVVVIAISGLLRLVTGTQRPSKDPVAEGRAARWAGPLGAYATAVAGIGLGTGPRAIRAASTRPTELSLADLIRREAAELPGELRAAFAGVDATADRLERAAARLTDRRARLVARLRTDPARASVLEVAIATVDQRRAEALDALRAVRQALGAARGGTAEIGAVTTAVEDALAVVERVEYLAQARDEVRESLR